MPDRIIYLPIEPYQARSTEYMSVEDGVYETSFKKLGIPFLAIRPVLPFDENKIKTGVVLDARRRARWGFEQINTLLSMIESRKVVPGKDVIYFEDFWTPGFEMVPYFQHLFFGKRQQAHVSCYAFCHAQTVDPYDFTYPMRSWMRPIEIGWANYLTGITVACKEIIPQMESAGWPIRDAYGQSKVHVCGLAYDGEAVRRLVGLDTHASNGNSSTRANRVLFTSRFDKEKNPAFFLSLATKVRLQLNRPDIEFIMCSGHDYVNSNSIRLEDMICFHATSKVIKLALGLSKLEYYKLLQTSRVQFNCADQDYISYTLLDSSLNNCAPLLPDYFTFPDAVDHCEGLLYKHKYLDSAVDKLLKLLKQPHGDYTWIYKKYESSAQRMTKAMGF